MRLTFDVVEVFTTVVRRNHTGRGAQREQLRAELARPPRGGMTNRRPSGQAG